MCSYQSDKRNSSLLTQLFVGFGATSAVLFFDVIWQQSYSPKAAPLHHSINTLESGAENEFQFCKCVCKSILQGADSKLPVVRWMPQPLIPRRLKSFLNKNARKLSPVSFLSVESADAGNPTAQGQFGAAREPILPGCQLPPTSPCWRSPPPAGCSPRCPAARCCTPPPCSARGRSTRSPNARPANHLCLISAATAAQGFQSSDCAPKALFSAVWKIQQGLLLFLVRGRLAEITHSGLGKH